MEPVAKPLPFDIIRLILDFTNSFKCVQPLLCKWLRDAYYKISPVKRRLWTLTWAYLVNPDCNVKIYCMGEAHYIAGKELIRKSKSICGEMGLAEKNPDIRINVDGRFNLEIEGVIRCLNISPKLMHRMNPNPLSIESVMVKLNRKIVKPNRAAVEEWLTADRYTVKIPMMLLDYPDLLCKVLTKRLGGNCLIEGVDNDNLTSFDCDWGAVVKEVINHGEALRLFMANWVFINHWDTIMKSLPRITVINTAKRATYSSEWSCIQLYYEKARMGSDFTFRISMNDGIREKMYDLRRTVNRVADMQYKPWMDMVKFLRYFRNVEPELCEINYDRHLHKRGLPVSVDEFLVEKKKKLEPEIRIKITRD